MPISPATAANSDDLEGILRSIAKDKARRVDPTLTAIEIARLPDVDLGCLVVAAEQHYLTVTPFAAARPYQQLAHRAGGELRRRASWGEPDKMTVIRGDIRNGLARTR